MKRIAFFTTSRSEFGGFINIIKEIKKAKDLEYCLFAGGAHLSLDFGDTKNEIIQNEISISDEFDFVPDQSDPYHLALASGKCQMEVARIFRDHDFDFVCVLGDRFELIPIVSTALLFNKPILHLHGGEVSEGAVDNQIRWMVTKAAHIHFPTCEIYADNIRKLGEESWRISVVGLNTLTKKTLDNLISKKVLFAELDLHPYRDTVLMTYHPESIDIKPSLEERIDNVFKSLGKYEFQVVITAPNLEKGREIIQEKISSILTARPNYKYFKSLGIKKYYSLIPHCKFIIGNSSSGINEVPYFKVPTVNVGSRQNGRLRHFSIVDTNYTVENIMEGIERSLSTDFRDQIKTMEYQFPGDQSTDIFLNKIRDIQIDNKLLIK